MVAQGQPEFPWLKSSGGWQSSVCPEWEAWVPAEAGEGEWRSSSCSRGQGRHYLAQKGLQVLPVQSGLVTGSVILEPRKEKRSTQLPQPWRGHRGRRAYGPRGYFPPTLRWEFLHPAPLGVRAQGYMGMMGRGLPAPGPARCPRPAAHGPQTASTLCGLLGKTRGLREPARKPHSERGSLRPREESAWSMPPPPPTSTTRASPRHG